MQVHGVQFVRVAVKNDGVIKVVGSSIENIPDGMPVDFASPAVGLRRGTVTIPHVKGEIVNGRLLIREYGKPE